MFGPQGLLPDSQRPLVQRLGVRILALSCVELRKVIQQVGHVEVPGSHGPFPDDQGPVVQRFGFRRLARPADLLPDSQGSPKQWLGFCILALVFVQDRQGVQRSGDIDVLGAKCSFSRPQSFLSPLDSLGVITLLLE